MTDDHQPPPHQPAEHPPTVDEVLERQRDEYPAQAASSTLQSLTEEERAALAAGGQAVEGGSGPGVDVEGPNSA